MNEKKQADQLLKILRRELQNYKPLKEIVVHYQAIGAARLIIIPSFSLPIVVTTVFFNDSLKINIKYVDPVANDKLNGLIWRSSGKEVPEEDREAAREILRSTRTHETTKEVGIEDVPEIFKSWRNYNKIAKEAKTCHTVTYDGTRFKHEMRTKYVVKRADWENPSNREHPLQIKILAAYEDLLRIFGFKNAIGCALYME